jgi:hypothetical protein
MQFKQRTLRTLVIGPGGDAQGSGSPGTVTECDIAASPLMRMGNFNVAGISRSNFKPGVNINENPAVLKLLATIKVVSVCDGVNVCVVVLRGVRGKRLQASASTRSPHACRARHNVQGRHERRLARRQPPPALSWRQQLPQPAVTRVTSSAQ